ncbi:MAG TPA: hypothetical protein VKC15_13660, partial [Gemmatimonadales bacterium]|nr:hypothetical protein [Gemmatimonadales bacterium]
MAPALTVAGVLALAVSITTCRLDKLINPATADRLLVDRDSVLASAHVGSVDPVATTVHIASADGLALRWTASKTAAWVTLDADSGSAPDSLVVRLHSDTLSKTLHRDTIVFTSLQSVVTVKVPIAFDMLDSAAQLVVSPPNRDTAALLGSAQPDTFSLRIKNKGALPLTWTATFNATWVTLSDSGGTVPAKDTTSTVVLVTLRPESLSTGPHSARIIFAAPGAIDAPDTVAITYTINPCAETTIPTLDTVVSGSIALSDCGAPQRSGRQAKLYGVQAVAGDTLTLRLSAAFNAYLIVTNNSGATVLDSTDECAAVGIACIRNFPVTTPGTYVIEATTANPAETGAFTLSAVKERAPSPPQAIGQFRGDSATAIGVGLTTTENVVVLKGTLHDPNPADSLRLQVELVGVGSGTKPDSSAPVPVGASVSVRVTPLVENETYYWRARTCDKTGRCSAWQAFGGNVDPAADFVVNAVLEPPALTGQLHQFGPTGEMGVGEGTGGAVLSNQTVTFQAGVT